MRIASVTLAGDGPSTSTRRNTQLQLQKNPRETVACHKTDLYYSRLFFTAGSTGGAFTPRGPPGIPGSKWRDSGASTSRVVLNNRQKQYSSRVRDLYT